MEPIRTTETTLQFAAPLSPLWLFALLPLVVLAGLWLYRGQWKDVARWQAAGIMALRCLLLAGLVFLAFRPSLLRRIILTFPGRIVLLLDDSESMSAGDTGLSEEEALRWARQLEAGDAARLPPCHQMTDHLAAAGERLRRFHVFAQAEDRTRDRFWAEAEAASRNLAEAFDACVRLTGGVTGLDADEKRKLDEAAAAMAALRAGAQEFFSGSSHPPARVYDAYEDRLEQARSLLFDLQAALDRRALADPGSPLHAVAGELRRQPRLALLTRTLARLKAEPGRLPARSGYECVRLLSGERKMLDAMPVENWKAAPGNTDLFGAIDRLVQEENPFPLAGIVLFSDGRHLGGGSSRATARAAAQKQAPLHAAAMGAAREPHDLALLDVVAPPFAVKGTPVTIRVRLKTILPEPAEVKVEVRSGDSVVAAETIRAGEAPEALCVLQVTPPETGRFRYTVQAPPLDIERLPARNNRRDFVLHVRDEKVRVLLLDGNPRWETRFVLNILQRLDYLDLNAIIVASQAESKLARGVRKGAWPRDRATLALYDVIILGDLPPDLLSPDEWAAVRESVEQGGKTVVFLGNAAGAARPSDPALAEALWPVLGLPSVPRAEGPDALDRLCLTDAGRLHPVTAPLGDALPGSGEQGVPRLRADTQVLALSAPAGEPLVAVRRPGRGKALLIDEDRLWKRLNPTLLDAHAALVLNLVTWAVDGDAGTDEAGRPAVVPLLDQHTLDIRGGLQVWLAGGATGAVIEAEAAGRVLQGRAAERTRPESDLTRAVFTGLPPEDIRFRIRGGGGAGSFLFGVESIPELGFVGRDDRTLAVLAAESGGKVAPFTESLSLLSRIPPKERVEKQEHLWRLWDARYVFAFLLVLLTAEWVWRKWVGLL